MPIARRFDLADLEAFVAVAEHGSIRRAAEALQLAQPSMTARLQTLERAVGRRVLVRTARGSSLTSAGDVLLAYARRCLAIADAMPSVALDVAESQTVHIGAHGSILPALYPRAVEVLARLDMRAACNDAHSDDVVRLVADGVFDVGFVLLNPALPRSVRYVHLFDDRVGCFMRPAHPLVSATQPLTVSELASGDISIAAWGADGDAFVEHLLTAGLPHRSLYRVSPAQTALQLARRYGHVAVVGACAAACEVDAGQLRAVEVADLPRWSMPVGLVYREEDQDRDVVQALVKAEVWATAD